MKKRLESFLRMNIFMPQFDKFPVSPGHAEIIPKRHVASLFNLIDEEWKFLKPALLEIIKIIETTNLKELYENFIREPLNETSKWFCEQMLKHPKLGKKPDGYNVGVNEDEAAVEQYTIFISI